MMPVLTEEQLKISVPPTHALVYEKIRQMLLDNVFKPGSKLNEVALAKTFGVSRGPIREAFQLLVSEGFLVSKKNRGVFVAEMTPADVNDIYYARLIIEREAFVSLQKHPDPKVFKELDSYVAKIHRLKSSEDWKVVTKCDVDFHSAVVHALNSKRVNEFYSIIISQIMLCISNLRNAYMEPAEIADEHLRLLELLQHGHKDELLDELDRHMNSAVDYLNKGE
jgi:DNA-binding GntR family transcriptional regulator